MSQWTHVNAAIRFDGLTKKELPTEKELGNICRWEDEDISHWGNCNIPCGSEGSIQYRIIKNPDKSALAAMVVVFYGDLRDYDDNNEIVHYFNRIIKDKFIRSGLLEIEVESKVMLVYRYNSTDNQWNLIYKEIYL